jgi:anti-sigma factor RsiW
MNCRDVDELLGAFCEGSLEDDSRRQVVDHLTGCAGCRKEKEVVARTLEALHGFERIEPSEDFSARLWQRIDQLETTRRALWLTAVAAFVRQNRRSVAACAMVFVISLLGGVMFLQHMVTGPALQVAEEPGRAENFVLREIPQTDAAPPDTFFMHFVTGDRPGQTTYQPEDYVFKPVVKPVSTASPAF